MSPEPSAEMQAVFSMAGISKSGPQYKDKILPADDNFLKIVAVGGGYLEEVRVLCVADKKEAAHMRDTLENLYFGNITPNDQIVKSGTALKKAMEQSAECEEKLKELILQMKAEIAAIKSGEVTEYPDGGQPQEKTTGRIPA